VLGGDVFTAFAFGIGCGVGENQDRIWRDFCESPLLLVPWLGATAVAVGALVAHWRRSYKPWLIGAIVGIASGVILWLLMGDPAGNFSGLRT
jgi:hypothetical protein